MSNQEEQNNQPTVRIVCQSLLEFSKILLFEHQSIGGAINEDYMYKWTPATPVFISAQTGSGKNTFIEDVIIRKVVRLNGKILILSNRIALSRQEKERIAELMDKIAPRKDRYNSFTREVERRCNAPEWLDELEDFGVVTIKSYQSVLTRQDNLANDYDFIIFDECHFFLADAKFNKYTDHILDTILKRYPYSIRIYMTATPNEVVIPIIKAENKNRPHNPDVRRMTPIGLKSLHQGQFYWDDDRSNYTLIDYNIREQSEPLETKIYPYPFGGGEQRHDTYETYNKYSAIIYEFERDYSYINCKYIAVSKAESSKDDKEISKPQIINRCQPLLNLLKKQIDEEKSGGKAKKEKWLIFVANKDDGHELLNAIGKENADYIDAGSKNDATYIRICSDGEFEKKVLITTSVIDNGINITDLLIKNVAIFVFDKVSFLQMLGRIRVKPSKKITLYIAEQTKKGLNWKFQESNKALNRIKRAKSNFDDVVKEVFDRDAVFFYTGYACDSKKLVAYNRFFEEKLMCEITFLRKVLNNNGTDNQTLQGDNSQEFNELTYEQYVQKLRGKESINKKIFEDKYSFEQRTILEQLSWIGQEDSFSFDNYLENASEESEEEKRDSKDKLLKFLDANAVEEVPDSSSEATNFFRERGMNEQKQEKFCEEFTELYIKSFGPRPEDKNNKIYNKNIIIKCFKKHLLPYEIISKAVKLDLEQRALHNTDKDRPTFWILKKQKLIKSNQ